jgi:hypothetical protein
MLSYPTLSANPTFPIETTDDDNIIRSDKAAGYVHKRARFTRLRRTFKFSYYTVLSDLYTILAFYKSVNGADSFFYKDFVEAYEEELCWLPNHVYNVGDISHPVTPTGRSYICTVSGTTGGPEPSWSTTENATFSDGGVTWKENSYTVTFGAPIVRKYTYPGVTIDVILEEM